MYINDLPDNLQSTVKLLADDILFSSMYEPNISASQLASDLKKKKNSSMGIQMENGLQS